MTNTMTNEECGKLADKADEWLDLYQEAMAELKEYWRQQDE